MSVHGMCVVFPGAMRESQSLRTGVTDCCELSMDAGTRTRVLWVEQPVLSTAELLFSPLMCFSFYALVVLVENTFSPFLLFGFSFL